MAISNCLFSPILRYAQGRLLKILVSTVLRGSLEPSSTTADFQFGVYLLS